MKSLLFEVLERFPTGWNHLVEKKTLQINKLAQVLTQNADAAFAERSCRILRECGFGTFAAGRRRLNLKYEPHSFSYGLRFEWRRGGAR
ncbi:MAG: hypothetical protein ACYC5H_05840 [Methylovirgula sp.]